MKTLLTLMICTILNACTWLPKGEDMANTLPDFDTLWNYGDPVGTRKKFLDILADAESQKDKSYLLQLKTQVARTWSLNMGFDEAHKILDDVESQITSDLKLVHVRYLLERGRTYRSSGDPQKALPLFSEAFELAKVIKEDFFAVDAAHMIALAVSEREEKRKWNLAGIQVAEQSQNERARNWLGSLYNNMGWDYHDEGEYEKALELFEKALAFRQAKGNVEAIGIAKWCIARTYRSLGRIEEALTMQLELLSEYESRNHKSGYVFEELGEIYLIKKDKMNSKKFFALAFEQLSKDAWLVKNESERLERIKRLGQD